ncbi:MAG TPA: adenosine kinase [Acidimicrobiales bacterium]|nr:adenosine kinase [Acidimicrobiales bacterium]
MSGTEPTSTHDPVGGAAHHDEPGALDVVALGSALVDVLTHAPDSDLLRLELAKGSMALVDLARAADLYGAMGPATEVSGGSAANTAAGVAALGGRAGYVGKVAADELGDVFVHDITAAGVLVGRGRPPMPPDPATDSATGRCLVFVTPDGERTMATHLGVAATLTPDDLDEELVGRARVLYIEGYLWDLRPAKAAIRRAVEVAHASDALVALSLSDPFCVERHQAEFLGLLHGEVDVVFANEDEIRLLFGATTFADAVSAVEETGVLAALTRGAAGSVAVSAQGPAEVAAAPVDAVVDTTGAGDLYAAGFLYGLTHGQDPEHCARLGGVCAAEVISHLGARPQADLRALAAAAGLA